MRETQNTSKVFRSEFNYYQRVAHKVILEICPFRFYLFLPGGTFYVLPYYSTFEVIELTKSQIFSKPASLNKSKPPFLYMVLSSASIESSKFSTYWLNQILGNQNLGKLGNLGNQNIICRFIFYDISRYVLIPLVMFTGSGYWTLKFVF